ncbi:hypothetical protein Peur_002524 [Populus x canadensis]
MRLLNSLHQPEETSQRRKSNSSRPKCQPASRHKASNPADGQQANLIRFNPPKTHQPATHRPSTSALKTCKSQPATSKTSRPQQANSKQNIRQKELQTNNEKPKQPNYK